MSEQQAARKELEFIQDLVSRTRQRIDPHGFHYVHWGLIVLVWFPLGNLFRSQGNNPALIGLVVGSIVLGAVLSAVREMRLARAPRLPGEDTFLTRQVVWIVYSSLVAGMLLSGLAPTLGLIDGDNVPIIWGLVYANIAFMTGVVYEREFLMYGILIFAGCVLAMVFQSYNGYILGPFMGLGMIVPGLRAERRVRRLMENKLEREAGQV
jgi:hypothetical protein